jgi:short-subunit dehydrogenase
MAIRQLRDKRVFITGAASGIGAATACAFAEQGCELMLADLDLARLEATAEMVRKAGASAHCFALDVSDPAQFAAVAREASERVGAPHVLINNAGIGAHGSFLNTPMDAVRRVIDVNLYGVYNGCRAFLPMMLAAGVPAHLLNVASLASISPMPNMSAYAASKYAVDGLTEVLAMELADSNVDVTCVHPGIINTPIVAGKSYNAEAGFEQERRLGEYYQARGSDPSIVAAGMVNAVQHGRAHLYVGEKAAMTEKLKRLSPSLMRKLAMSMARKIGYA